jgi:hypothetical protein
MADTKISDLSAVTDVVGTDEYVLARSGATKKITAASLSSGLIAASDRRRQLELDALGIIVQTMDQKVCDQAIAPTAGNLNAALVGLVTGDVVTSIVLHVVSNGSGVTLAKVGLYDQSGTLLASSADVDTTFTSGSVPRKQVTNLSSPYTVTSDGAYYLAFVTVGGTSPTLLRASTRTSAAIAGGVLPYGALSGQTDLPSSITLPAAVNSTWMAAA